MQQFFIIFFGILLLVFLIGCSAYQADVSWPEPRPLGKELASFHPSIYADKQQQFSEPKGVLTLPQALTLSLMHNPDLRAFSWEVCSGDARTLQAGLRPNPELEAEIEEFGGSGVLSGFRGIETAIQLSYLIELGGKGGKRRSVASLETELAGWDYETARLDVLTQTAQAFIDVLAAQELVALNGGSWFI